MDAMHGHHAVQENFQQLAGLRQPRQNHACPSRRRDSCPARVGNALSRLRQGIRRAFGSDCLEGLIE